MNNISNEELKNFLDEKHDEFNRPSFISLDPISIPHKFDKKEDIEISGFLAATIAWGNRASILKNAEKLVKEMGYNPHEFIMNASEPDYKALDTFVHRTFNGTDTLFFLKSIKNIYQNHGGLETVFTNGYNHNYSLFGALVHFRNVFLDIEHQKRSEKHVANVEKKSSGKRLCMYLRWMVRDDKRGVDFGLWKGIPPSALMLPLDVHTGNISRKLHLLERTQNDWQAVEQLTQMLRTFDATDPVKYDFALFGLGITHQL